MENRQRQYFAVVPSLQKGGLVRTSFEDHIRQSLRAVVLTQVGERKLHPQLGSTVRNYLFRPLTSDVKAEIRTAIETAIAVSEPRVELLSAMVSSDEVDRSKMLVQLKYRCLPTQKVEQMTLHLAP